VINGRGKCDKRGRLIGIIATPRRTGVKVRAFARFVL
jgi:hypothetical protein